MHRGLRLLLALLLLAPFAPGVAQAEPLEVIEVSAHSDLAYLEGGSVAEEFATKLRWQHLYDEKYQTVHVFDPNLNPLIVTFDGGESPSLVITVPAGTLNQVGQRLFAYETEDVDLSPVSVVVDDNGNTEKLNSAMQYLSVKVTALPKAGFYIAELDWVRRDEPPSALPPHALPALSAALASVSIQEPPSTITGSVAPRSFEALYGKAGISEPPGQ